MSEHSMARPRNFKGSDGRYSSKNKYKSGRSNDGSDRHHGYDRHHSSSSSSEHRDNRDFRDLKPLLAVDPGPSSLLNSDPTAFRYRYSSSSKINANNYYRHNRFRMLNGHPLGRLRSMDSTDSGDGIIAGTSSASSTTTPLTELPNRPTTEPSAPPIELASPTHSLFSEPKLTAGISPNHNNIDLPPTYDDVMSGAHLRKQQLSFAPSKTHSNSTPDITSDHLGGTSQQRTRSRQSGSLNGRVSEEEEGCDDGSSIGETRRQTKAKGRKTTASKIKKGLENIAFFLIQILD